MLYYLHACDIVWMHVPLFACFSRIMACFGRIIATFSRIMSIFSPYHVYIFPVSCPCFPLPCPCFTITMSMFYHYHVHVFPLPWSRGAACLLGLVRPVMSSRCEKTTTTHTLHGVFNHWTAAHKYWYAHIVAMFCTYYGRVLHISWQCFAHIMPYKVLDCVCVYTV